MDWKDDIRTNPSQNQRGDFDLYNYQKIERLARRFQQDPFYKTKVKKLIEQREKKAQARIGKFGAEDYLNPGDLSAFEGLNSNRSQIREINLKNYNIEVDDADTLILHHKFLKTNKSISIRMAGIDAPETTHDDPNDPLRGFRIKQNQPLGRDATDALKSLMAQSKNIRLLVDPTQKTYGRYLGVLMDSNKNINLELVRKGYVSSLEFGTQQKNMVDMTRFYKEGELAEKQERGLWSNQFFKNWRMFSAGQQSDLTFNSLTNAIRLAENKAMGVAAGFIWGEGEASEQLFNLGVASKAMREGQKLSKAGLIANSPGNPVNRREDQNSITGMNHGWFGRMRSGLTPFGSPFRIGDEEYQNVKQAISQASAFDIETKSLIPTSGSVIQLGFSDPNNGIKRINIFQTDKSYRTPFSEKHVLKQVEDIEGFSFEKLTKPINKLTDLGKRGKMGIETSTVTMQEALSMTEKILSDAKKSSPLLIHNARFEISHFFRRMYGLDNIGFSENYKEARKNRSRLERIDRRDLAAGKINYNQYIENKIQRQKDFFKVAIKEKQIIDTQEIAKTMNALAQEKGLIAKTGKIEIGTSLDFLTKAMYGYEEIHSSGIDAYDTRKVASEMVDMIYQMGKLNSNKPLDMNGFSTTQRKWLGAWGNISGNKNTMKAAAEKFIFESEYKKIEQELLQGNNLRKISPTRGMHQLGETGIDIKRIHEEALASYRKVTGKTNSLTDAMRTTGKYSGIVRKSVLSLGGLALGASFANAFLFSGRDDDANTIEGLPHGGMGQQIRKTNTPFGSGYQMDQFHSGDPIDPIPASYVALGGLGAGALGMAAIWNQPTRYKINDLKHLGKLHTNMTNSQLIGRENATVGEVLTASVKRAEQSMGGLFRVFGVGDQMMISVLNNMDLTVDLLNKTGSQHVKLLHEITQRNLLKEGFERVKISKNKMTAYHPLKGWQNIEGYYHPIPLIHNMDLTKTPTQTALSYMRMHGINGVEEAHSAFIIGGGRNRFQSIARRAHGYVHESLVKGMKVLDEPLGAIQELFPAIEDNGVFSRTKKILDKVPKLGAGGNYNGSAYQLLKRHSSRLSIASAALFFGYGTLDWMVKEFTPGDNIISQGGIAGIGAEALRSAHMTYASLSEGAGLTALRSKIEEAAPGSNGWGTSLGMTLSGGLMGATLASMEGLADEIGSTDRYAQFLRNKKHTEGFSGPLKSVFKGEYTKSGRFMRVGALAGLAASLPFLISGLGSSQTVDEWNAEYRGEKEVAVRKGRFWEGSMSPWEGDKIDYYRPNWYARLKDNYTKEALYDGENYSPIGRAIRSLWDPYWLEKKHYAESPYPYTGPDGSALGMLGPLYEMTLGRALKAPMYINHDEFLKEYYDQPEKYPVSEELGGIAKADPRDPSSLLSGLRRSVHTVTEGLGLRGFAASSMFEKATGESNIDAYTPELASAARLDSLSRAFWDLQAGGGGLTTEAIRRIMPRERVGDTERVNPLKNNMPSWMPGDESNYYINFHRGDPYDKIKEGYYRLPGQGYASRFKELEGLSPEDYPDIYKYKILADVAPDSNEFDQVRGRLQNRELTEYEAELFVKTETQLKDKAQSVEKFRDPAIYNSLLGKYTAAITDFARGNPVEQLLPFAPARKFLPGADPISRYEETVYGKDFQDWKNPLTDFIRPAITMTGNLVGQAEIPEEMQYARELEDYFDKLKYLKSKRLAREASQRGDTRGEGFYLGQADRTMTGVDPYMDSNELLRRIPKRERPFFQHFLSAGADEKEKIMGLVPSNMQDIYRAQWEKQALAADPENESLREEIQERAQETRARRKQAALEANTPDADWIGWRKDVDLEDVKLKHLINEGRDYHYHGLWKDRVNMLARKPYIDQAANQLNYNRESSHDAYMEALNNAQSAGIMNPDVVVMPSIQQGYNLNISVDRRGQRNEILRDLGYVI